jgi:hypothetical protein
MDGKREVHLALTHPPLWQRDGGNGKQATEPPLSLAIESARRGHLPMGEGAIFTPGAALMVQGLTLC